MVDDDRALREVLRRVLSLSGYEVRLAESGAHALTEVGTLAPDAIVLDIGLPDIDGLDVCRMLRREGNRGPSASCDWIPLATACAWTSSSWS